MVFLPRHHEYKKKKSKAGFILIPILIAFAGLVYTQERKIRIFLSGDLTQKIEKQIEKIRISLQNNELTDVLTRDFHTYTDDYLEKEPLKPSANFFKSLAFYYELMLSGARFDSFSLVQRINDPVQVLFGENEKANSDSQMMFVHAKRATSLEKGFDEIESNRFLQFLGESLRNKKNPKDIYSDYQSIDSDKLYPDLQHPHTWLLFYTVVKTGKLAELEKLLDRNGEENYPGKLLLTEREIDFLKGETHFYGNDYVLALNNLRRVKTQENDPITMHATLTEAKIFFRQNLPKKGIDLLLNEIQSGRDKNKIFLQELKVWAMNRPDLNIEVPKEKKEVIIDEDEI